MFGKQIILALLILINCVFICYAQIAIEREYYNDNRLKSEKHWKGTYGVEIWKSYYEDGSLKEEFDKEKNILREYYQNGNLKSEYFFNKKDRKIIKHYFEDGKIMSIGIFLPKNPLTGVEKHYDENGKLIFIYKYRDGKIVDIKKIK